MSRGTVLYFGNGNEKHIFVEIIYFVGFKNVYLYSLLNFLVSMFKMRHSYAFTPGIEKR